MRTYFVDGKWIPEAERDRREAIKANERDNDRRHRGEVIGFDKDADPYHTNPKSENDSGGNRRNRKW